MPGRKTRATDSAGKQGIEHQGRPRGQGRLAPGTSGGAHGDDECGRQESDGAGRQADA